jgi:hypothetical protein
VRRGFVLIMVALFCSCASTPTTKDSSLIDSSSAVVSSQSETTAHIADALASSAATESAITDIEKGNEGIKDAATDVKNASDTLDQAVQAADFTALKAAYSRQKVTIAKLESAIATQEKNIAVVKALSRITTAEILAAGASGEKMVSAFGSYDKEATVVVDKQKEELVKAALKVSFWRKVAVVLGAVIVLFLLAAILKSRIVSIVKKFI